MRPKAHPTEGSRDELNKFWGADGKSVLLMIIPLPHAMAGSPIPQADDAVCFYETLPIVMPYTTHSYWQ